MKKLLILFLIILFFACKKDSINYTIHLHCKATAILDSTIKSSRYSIQCYINNHHIISNYTHKSNELVFLDTTIQLHSNDIIYLFTYINSEDTVSGATINTKSHFI